MPTNLSTFLSYNISTSQSRTVTRSVATNGQTTFNVTYKVGFVDVFLNGSKLDSTEYTASNGTSVVLSEAAVVNDIVECVSYNDAIVTGLVLQDNTSTNSNRNILFTEGTSGSISTITVSSSQLTYNPATNTLNSGNLNISGVGTVTTLIPNQTRVSSIAEKLIRVNGNTVSIGYASTGTNVGLCTNPTGDITLNVTGIPTDSSFDNHMITFSVVVNQTGTARSCTAVNLNGVSRTINWSGGSLASAISGVTTTNGIDIYNFVGINTIGSANTTSNYRVLGIVNGGFR